VLSIGGNIEITEDRKGRKIGAVGDLPPGRFELTVVNLYQTSKVRDAGLAAFKDCKNITYLNLSGTGAIVAELVYFKDCKNLTVLELGCTQVSDAGLAHLTDYKNLAYFGLGATQVSDTGLTYFKWFDRG